MPRAPAAPWKIGAAKRITLNAFALKGAFRHFGCIPGAPGLCVCLSVCLFVCLPVCVSSVGGRSCKSADLERNLDRPQRASLIYRTRGNLGTVRYLKVLEYYQVL